MQTNIWWIRRDLRLYDNPALHAAIASADAIIPLFILDPVFERSEYVGEKRVAFLFDNLRVLDETLKERGGRLIIRQGDPSQVLHQLFQEVQASTIFAQKDVSPYGTQRDELVTANLPLVLSEGMTVHPSDSIHKADNSPYTVFTPFSKTWKQKSPPSRSDLLPVPDRILVPEAVQGMAIPEEPKQSNDALFPPGEVEAQKRLHAFVNPDDGPIYTYKERRNRMDLEGTSALSPYLRFGVLSPRQAVVDAYDAAQRGRSPEARKSAETWLNELIWREFFISILHHYPYVRNESFRADYRNLAWDNNTDAFESWTSGQTGYPVVDAAMRQLHQSGWMHNRARMIVASFLVKDLLIDWRWGERWFMQHLIDGDPAANNGGWQWSAGTGTDAAPYFRIFNPILQSKKFDPHGDYIRHWVPELSKVPSKHIHAPWEMTDDQMRESGVTIDVEYPSPIIDHRFARERTLNAFRKAKGS